MEYFYWLKRYLARNSNGLDEIFDIKTGANPLKFANCMYVLVTIMHAKTIKNRRWGNALFP